MGKKDHKKIIIFAKNPQKTICMIFRDEFQYASLKNKNKCIRCFPELSKSGIGCFSSFD